MSHDNVRHVPMAAVATVTLLFLGVLYAWSMFRVELSKVFTALTASQLSMNFTIAMTAFCVGGFTGGKLSARYSPKFSARLAAALVFTGYFGVSFMEKLEGGAALALLYVSYGAVAGLGTGIGHNCCVGSVPLWFPERMGLVSGVLLMGFGIGSLVLGLLIESLSAAIGVFNVFRLYAVLLAAALIAVSFFLKEPPLAEKRKNGSKRGLTPGQMLKRPSFWIYFLWNIIVTSSGLLVMNSAANIAVYFGAAAGLGLVVSVFNGVGRPVTGAVMDRLGQFRGMLMMNGLLVVSALALLATAVSGSVAMMTAGLLGIGIVYGGGATINAKVINVLYGPEHYAVNYSLSNFCMIPASFIGPYISGLLQDRSGGYTSTFVMLAAAATAGLAVNVLLKLRLKREETLY